MAVYVDDAIWPWRGRRWAHLMADSLDELHVFAAELGLKRTWFQSRPGGAAHYDVTASMRWKAIVYGATALTRPDDNDKIKAVIRQARAQLQAPPQTAASDKV